MLDKKQIAKTFGKKAAEYDTYARVQKYVGSTLLSKLSEHEVSIEGPILDLGTGSGYFLPEIKKQFPNDPLFALDLSEGMIKHASSKYSSLLAAAVVSDAEHLPFVDNSFAVIYSSMAIQWCEDIDGLLKELCRVVKPGGLIAFSTLLPKTLHELKDAWQTIDQGAHVNRFLDSEVILDAMNQNANIEHFKCEFATAHYSDLKTLLHSIKGIGANTVVDGSKAMSKGQYKQLIKAYDQCRSVSGQLPATYDVCYGILRVEK